MAGRRTCMLYDPPNSQVPYYTRRLPPAPRSHGPSTALQHRGARHPKVVYRQVAAAPLVFAQRRVTFNRRMPREVEQPPVGSGEF